MADPTALGTMLLHLVTVAYLVEHGFNLLFAPKEGADNSFKLPEYLTPPPTGVFDRLPTVPLRDLATLCTAWAHAHAVEMEVHNYLQPNSVPPLVDQWIAAALIAGLAHSLRKWMRRGSHTSNATILTPPPQQNPVVHATHASADAPAGTATSGPTGDAANNRNSQFAATQIAPPRATPRNRIAVPAASAPLFRLGGLVRLDISGKSNNPSSPGVKS